MILNAYGSAILQSERDFVLWAADHGIESPIKRKIESEPEGKITKYQALVAEGYKVRVIPSGIPHIKKYDCVKRNQVEEYQTKKFLYQFIFIANTIGIDYAEKWVNRNKDDKYRQEEYVRMVKNKPKLAYCHLKSSNGQCNMGCPFWRGKCQISSAEEQRSRALLEEYKPIKKKISKGWEE